MRNPILLLTLLASAGAVILAAVRQRRTLDARDRSAASTDGFPERRRGDRPEPPAPTQEHAPDNLEPFSKPGSVDERR